MTREEKQKAIDALRISTPIIAVTYEEFDDYIRIRNKIMDWLEQIPMRDATLEERKSVDGYINSISKPTGVNFGYLEQDPCDDCISRQAAIDCVTYDEEYTVECLNALPPVTPQTNIGWWIDEKVDGGRKVYCSKCNGSAVFEYVNDGDIYSSYGHGVVKKTKYCPNCGTKMLELNNVDLSKYTLQNVKESDNNDT